MLRSGGVEGGLDHVEVVRGGLDHGTPNIGRCSPYWDTLHLNRFISQQHRFMCHLTHLLLIRVTALHISQTVI
jgi:hypothetical protein